MSAEQLLAALLVALPYVVKHGTTDEVLQCGQAVAAATKANHAFPAPTTPAPLAMPESIF